MNLQALKDQLDQARQENCLIRYALCDRVEMEFLDVLDLDVDWDEPSILHSGSQLSQISDELSSTRIDSYPRSIPKAS